MSDDLPSEKIEAIIEKSDPIARANLPPELKKTVVQAVAMVASRATMYSGPVPPASMLEEYSRIIPDGGNRLLKLTESQQSHRIAMESKVIDGQVRQSGRGQWMAFILAMVLIGVGTAAVLTNHDTVAGVIFGTTIVALAGTFVFGKAAQSANLQAKKPESIETKKSESNEIVPAHSSD